MDENLPGPGIGVISTSDDDGRQANTKNIPKVVNFYKLAQLHD